MNNKQARQAKTTFLGKSKGYNFYLRTFPRRNSGILFLYFAGNITQVTLITRRMLQKINKQMP